MNPHISDQTITYEPFMDYNMSCQLQVKTCMWRADSTASTEYIAQILGAIYFAFSPLM